LTLARRVLPEASSFSLSALNKRYQLVEGDLRGAAPDVEAVVKLFQNWYGPRLTAAGIVGFQAVAEFSRQTPPAKCRKLIEAAVANQALPVPSTPPPPPRTPADYLAEFNQLVRDIMADGVMTTPEFLIMMDWLRDCPHTEVYPVNRLQEAVERVTAQDGQVTAEDQERLEKAFRYYLETGKAPPRPGEEGGQRHESRKRPLPQPPTWGGSQQRGTRNAERGIQPGSPERGTRNAERGIQMEPPDVGCHEAGVECSRASPAGMPRGCPATLGCPAGMGSDRD
jgi:hypothetical protein